MATTNINASSIPVELVNIFLNFLKQQSISKEKQDIEFYDGTTSVDDWLEECHNLAITYMWEETDFKKIFGSRLREIALDWHVDRLDSHRDESYASWKKAFIQKFRSLTYLYEKRNHFYSRNGLQQKQEESVQDFIYKVKRAYRSVYAPASQLTLLREDLLTQVFMNGVLPSIKNIMLDPNFVNDLTCWSGITEAALKAENYIDYIDSSNRRRKIKVDFDVIKVRFNGLKQGPNEQMKHFINKIESVFESRYGPIIQQNKDETEDDDKPFRLNVQDDILIRVLDNGMLPDVKEGSATRGTGRRLKPILRLLLPIH